MVVFLSRRNLHVWAVHVHAWFQNMSRLLGKCERRSAMSHFCNSSYGASCYEAQLPLQRIHTNNDKYTSSNARVTTTNSNDNTTLPRASTGKSTDTV